MLWCFYGGLIIFEIALIIALRDGAVNEVDRLRGRRREFVGFLFYSFACGELGLE